MPADPHKVTVDLDDLERVLELALDLLHEHNVPFSAPDVQAYDRVYAQAFPGALGRSE